MLLQIGICMQICMCFCGGRYLFTTPILFFLFRTSFVLHCAACTFITTPLSQVLTMNSFVPAPCVISKSRSSSAVSATCSSWRNRVTTYAAAAKPPTPPSSSSNPSWSNNSWDKAGKRFENVKCETIEFVIRPGGLVEEIVTGVKGSLCENVRC